MEIGDVVTKESRKKFQNGKKFAIIESFGEMEIPVARWRNSDDTQIVPCVYLVGCNGPVRASGLNTIEHLGETVNV